VKSGRTLAKIAQNTQNHASVCLFGVYVMVDNILWFKFHKSRQKGAGVISCVKSTTMKNDVIEEWRQYADRFLCCKCMQLATVLQYN